MQSTSNTEPENGRRNFLKYVIGGSFLAWSASVLYPILAYLKPPKQSEVAVSSVKAGLLKDIPKDSGQIVKFGSKPVILLRTAKGDMRAFSASCTHLECTVQYKKEDGVIWCACHNGKYDLNGKNISGPPPRPLEEFKVSIKGEEVVISKLS